MAKKQTTTKTTKTATPKAKYYIVMDSDQDIICQGEWDEIKEALDEYMEGNDDDGNLEMLSDFMIYELGVGKKLKYIPHVPASVSL
jgi:hypothetical protein